MSLLFGAPLLVGVPRQAELVYRLRAQLSLRAPEQLTFLHSGHPLSLIRARH